MPSSAVRALETGNKRGKALLWWCLHSQAGQQDNLLINIFSLDGGLWGKWLSNVTEGLCVLEDAISASWLGFSLSCDLNDVEDKGGQSSRQRGQQVQRSWGGDELGYLQRKKMSPVAEARGWESLERWAVGPYWPSPTNGPEDLGKEFKFYSKFCRKLSEGFNQRIKMLLCV